MADTLSLISESSLVPSAVKRHENKSKQLLLSSDDDLNDSEDGSRGISYGPLGLVDEEDILVLPPEDYGEISDLERTRFSINAEKSEDLSCLEKTKVNFTLNRDSGDADSPHSKKKKRKKIFTVNLTNCKYESVRRVMRRFGFREVEEDEEWNLYWTDFSVSIDRVVVMKTWQKINHFPGMTELCRKDLLARNLNRMLKLFPKEYNIFPKTWCLPADWNELQNHARKHKTRTYIFKPDSGCQGKGIYIARSFKDIRPMENMICQVYISKPFLIDGYKFDIRLYVLLTSCDPLRLYVFRDGLVRFTTIPYAEPNQRNMHNMYMHLTNYAVQKHSEGFIRDDEEGGTKRRITTLNRWFKQNGYDLQKIWNDVDDVVIKTVLSGYAVLRHNYRTCFPNHVQTSACFEVLGFDIMFNHKLKPYVLEVNHSPSFTTDSKLDREIKEAMLYDTLNLAHFGMLSKRKCMEDERKRIRNRLMQKAGKKDLRDATEKEQARYLAISERYEKSHMGNFRLIYPTSDPQKYDQFLNPSASFYTETVTYKVRSECARQQREEIRQKREKIDSYQNNRQKPVMPPESPGLRKSTANPSKSNPNSKRNTASRVTSGTNTDPVIEKQTESHPWGDQSPSTSPKLTAKNCSNPAECTESTRPLNSLEALWTPQPILDNEEAERLVALQQRKRLMKSIGLIDVIYRLLANSRGVCSVLNSVANSETKSLQSIHLVEPTDELKRENNITSSPLRPKRSGSNNHLMKNSSLNKSSDLPQSVEPQHLITVKQTNNWETLDKIGRIGNIPNSTEVKTSSHLSTIGQKLQAISSRSFRRNQSATQLLPVTSTSTSGGNSNISVAFRNGNILLASLNGTHRDRAMHAAFDFRNPSGSNLIRQNNFSRAMPASMEPSVVHPISNTSSGTELYSNECVSNYGIHCRPAGLQDRGARHDVIVRNFPAHSAFPGFRGFKTKSMHQNNKLAYMELNSPSMLDHFNNNAKEQTPVEQRISSHGKRQNQTVWDTVRQNVSNQQQTMHLTGSTFRPGDSLVRQLTPEIAVLRTNS